MIRKIITIDEEKCTGCGACANACHEGAIGMVNGKAKLLRDDYCDGLGDCLLHVLPVRYPLQKEKLPVTMPKLSKPPEDTAAVPRLATGLSRLSLLQSVRLTSATLTC